MHPKLLIPRVATLHDHVAGNVTHGKPPGPDTILTPAEETMLCKWLAEMSEIGYGRTATELKLAVKKNLDLDKRQNPFKENWPGPDWFRAFLRCHPTISVR